MGFFGMIPTIKKPTRFRLDRLPALLIIINSIITNSIMHTGFKSGIIKTDISDHFPIFICYKNIVEKEDAKNKFLSNSQNSQ